MFGILKGLFGTNEDVSKEVPSEEDNKIEELQEFITEFTKPFLSRIHRHLDSCEISENCLIYPKPCKLDLEDDAEKEGTRPETFILHHYPFGECQVAINDYGALVLFENPTDTKGDELKIEIKPNLKASLSLTTDERLPLSDTRFFYEGKLKMVAEYKEFQRILNRLGVIFSSHKMVEYIELNDEEMVRYYQEGKRRFEEKLEELKQD